MSSPVDQMSIEFVPNSGPPITINNWTSYNLTSDFFTPIDSFNFQLADDRVSQLVSKINIGDQVKLTLNGIPQLTGYLNKVNLNYSRASGTVLNLAGRDLLGIVADAQINPAIQSQVSPSSTYSQVFDLIFQNFRKNNLKFAIIEDDSGLNATLASGGRIGKSNSKNVGGKKRTRGSALTAAQLRPYKEEGYLQYMMRLCSRNGWTVKLSGDGQNVYIYSPTYDRETGIAFNLVHNLTNDLFKNNIKSGGMAVDWSQQPSLMIGETNVSGGNFRRGDASVIYINEITGYDKNGNILSDIKSISDDYKKKGTLIIPTNSQLRSALPDAVLSANTDPDLAPARVKYIFDQDCVSADQLEFFMREKASQYMNKFFTLDYEVDGHTDKITGNIWSINNLVNVYDETFGINAAYWIQSRTFTKDRSGGTRTTLHLTLPYCWNLGDG